VATGERGHVRLGIQLLDGEGRVVSRDFARVDLPGDVVPGASLNVTAVFAAPAHTGRFRLKFDLVAEGVTWFEPTGSPVETRPLDVRA